MRRGNVLVDQVTKDGLLIEGYDESLSSSEMFERISKYLYNFSKIETVQNEEQKMNCIFEPTL